MTRVNAAEVLEVGDIRWELEALNGGTRLTLWHSIDRRFISWCAERWHSCFDVLDRVLNGRPIGRMGGGDALKLGGWQRFTVEFAKEFGAESPSWTPPPDKGR